MRFFYYIIFQLCFSLIFVSSVNSRPGEIPFFSFYLLGEPYSLDPAQIRGLSSRYIFYNVYRSLFRYHPQKGLVPEGAKKCYWQSSLKLVCDLNPNVLWSNNTPVNASHYVKAFQRIIDPQTKSLSAEHLYSLKNAKHIHSEKMSVKKLGVKATRPFQLLFLFEKKDPEFLYKVSNATFAPIYNMKIPDRDHVNKLVVNGPYTITSWKKGHRIELKPNPYYKSKNQRPPLKILFVEDDTTALNLYQTGHIDFLRHIHTTDIPVYKNEKDFHQIPMAKFDYLGFGPELQKKLHLRMAMAHSLDYSQLQKLYHALGRPGCPSLPTSYQSEVTCYEFNLKKAKTFLRKASPNALKKTYHLYFSKFGGDDFIKGMQWFQHQWKKNLGLNIELKPIDSGHFLTNLRSHPPDIFRKGIPLDRPSCLSALENFKSNAVENYIKYKNQKFEKLVLSMPHKNPQKQKQICSKAISLLMKDYVLIPLGEIHYSMRIKSSFKGWFINELNQLDLTNLRYEK